MFSSSMPASTSLAQSKSKMKTTIGRCWRSTSSELWPFCVSSCQACVGASGEAIINMSSMDGMASLPANGYYSSSKFALEGLTEALWQEIEPLGLRAILVEPGSFRTGIEQRTKFSGTTIADYAATSGAFRAALPSVTPDMFPGDPARAAEAVYEVVTSDRPRHWVILGSDAHRRIGVKLDMLRAEYEAGKDMAFSTDYPGAGPAVL